jgi:hypothetical protein
MTSQITRIELSESTDGRPIEVVRTATAGTLIHTATRDPNVYDQVHIWASNGNSSTEVVVLEWGGVTNADDRIYSSVLANTTAKITEGWVIRGNDTPLSLKAYSTTTNKVNIVGYVDRVTQ